jgi:hypothetical protein
MVELATGTVRRTIPLPHAPTRESKVDVRFDRSGRTMAVGARGGFVFDFATGRLLLRTPDAVSELSPDGRWVLTYLGQLFDVRRPDAEPFELTSTYPTVRCAAFSHDSRYVCVGYPDGTAVVWDTAEVTRRMRSAAPKPPVPLDAAWEQLSDPDAAKAEPAFARLLASPADAVKLAAGQLRAVPAVTPVSIREQVAKLDSAAFAEREASDNWLRVAGEQTEGELKAALAKGLSPEQKRRVQGLLERFAAPDRTPERLRTVRAIELLERIGTAEAKAVLEKLAAGAPTARTTLDAKAALDRLPR